MDKDLVSKLALTYVAKKLQLGEAPSRTLTPYRDTVESLRQKTILWKNVLRTAKAAAATK